MNKLHIALLSASMFFSASVFCSETPINPPADVSRFAQVGNAIKALALFPVVTTPNFIAEKTYLNAGLQWIASFNCLGGAEGRIAKATPTIGHVIVLAAMTAAAYKAYKMYNAEETVETEEDFFNTDETDNN